MFIIKQKMNKTYNQIRCFFDEKHLIILLMSKWVLMTDLFVLYNNYIINLLEN